MNAWTRARLELKVASGIRRSRYPATAEHVFLGLQGATVGPANQPYTTEGLSVRRIT
jgi:hypothetical protein